MATLRSLKKNHPAKNKTIKMVTSSVNQKIHLRHRASTNVALKTQPGAKNSNSENILTLCKQGRLKEALHAFHVQDCPFDSYTYISLLQGCIKKKALAQGKLIHAHMKENGYLPDISVQNTVVNMYAKCASLEDARRAFNQISHPDAFSWTVIIAGYAKRGYAEEALALFRQMQRTGIRPDAYVFASVLPACSNLETIKEIHEEINRCGFQSDAFVGSGLVDLYAKFGSIENAREVFDKIPQRDSVLWNAMISAYSKQGLSDEALRVFYKMRISGILPNEFCLASVLQACANSGALEQGMKMHGEIVRSGYMGDLFIGNSLIDMYVKCGSIDNARSVFDIMCHRDEVSWTVIIAGYAKNGCNEEAIKLFAQMRQEGLRPTLNTFVSVLPAYANLEALGQGMEIHEEIIKSGLQSNVFVGSALVDMYAKCGSLEKARDVFDKMVHRNAVTWTAMIAGYVQNGFAEESLKLFHLMKQSGIQPNQFTFSSVFRACANLGLLELGMEIHDEIIRTGFQPDAFVESALVDMYAKCGNLEKARNIFDKMCRRDVVSWTVMVSGYAQHGYVDEALKLFQKMPERSIISWNAMIAGYVQNGRGVEALELFKQIPFSGLKQDSTTFTSVLPACANMVALEQGVQIHEEIIKNGFDYIVSVANALIDMYAKCGNIQKAHELFDKMHERDVVSWTTMIAGYAMHGHGEEAIKLFQEMEQSSMSPNHVTLLSVLSACCHSGLVKEGLHYFYCMNKDYKITPSMEHYGCIVDLLGRTGLLDEALDFIHKMPIKPASSVWISLLSACRTHNDINLGQHIAEQLFELDPNNTAPYVLLSNIYAAAGRWSEIERVRKLMMNRGVRKMPGCSWIEVHKHVHTFLSGDRSHPQMQEIYAELERLSREMRAAGYVAETKFVLNDAEDENYDQILCPHIEKLELPVGY